MPSFWNFRLRLTNGDSDTLCLWVELLLGLWVELPLGLTTGLDLTGVVKLVDKSLGWTFLSAFTGVQTSGFSNICLVRPGFTVPAFSGMFEVMGRAFSGPVLPLLSVVCCCALMTGF